MPMEANPAGLTTSIQPVRRTEGTNSTAGVVRRGDTGSSPFAPQTNVNIKNSIADMAGILSKISTNQEDAVEVMPQQIQKLVQNVLQQSFSLQTTLAEGLGSTVESQRFSMEQLNILSRMLSQLSTMSEHGLTTDLSGEMQAFLQNLKGFMTENNSSLEPVLLHKLAFQLLDTKSADDVPAALQALLTQANASAVNTSGTAQNEGLAFLKQLIQYFMPTAETESSENTNASATPKGTMASTANEASGTAAAKPATTAMAAEAEPVTAQGESTAKQSTSAARPQAAQTMQPSAEAEAGMMEQPEKGTMAAKPEVGNTAANQRPSENGTSLPQAAKDPSASLPTEGNTGQGNLAEQASSTEEMVSGKNTETAFMGKDTAASAKSAANMGASTMGTSQAASADVPEMLQNVPQTMETMKSLASLLLKDAQLTEQDQQLLQNFVNGKQEALPEKDAKQLQLLLRLCQKNIPASVQQASQQNMEGLPKLWAFMQLCDLASIKEQNSRVLKNASKNIADFAAAMKNSMEGDHSQNVEGQRSMNFMMPLYLGETTGQQQSYPAYIHIYDEEKESSDKGKAPVKETWLRLCLLTENIGAVELTCRIYENSKLNVRLFFSQAEAVRDFQEYIPEFKASFQDSKLELTDLKVGMAGTKS